jgi:Domain of unknown function (DUF1843)
MSELIYGDAMMQAVARGDLARMKELAGEAEAYLARNGNVVAALEALRFEITKLEYRQTAG